MGEDKTKVSFEGIDPRYLVEQVARHIVDGYVDWDNEGSYSHTLRSHMSKRVEAMLSQIFSEAFREEVKEQAKAKVSELLRDGFTRYSSYGEPEGKVTLETLVRDMLSSKTEKRNYNDPDRNMVQKFVSEILSTEVQREVKRQVEAAVSEAMSGVKAHVASMAGQFIEEQLKKRVGG